MKLLVYKGDIEQARSAAKYIGQHVNAWEHGMSVTVEPYVPPRTLKQNGLYHVLLEKYARQSGDHPKELKQAFANEFAPRKVVRLRDKQVSVPIPDSEWSKEQMSEMIERVLHEAAELNFNLD